MAKFNIEVEVMRLSWKQQIFCIVRLKKTVVLGKSSEMPKHQKHSLGSAKGAENTSSGKYN
jgi:hypothetical protein